MPNFLLRTITALILIPVIFLAIFCASPVVFAWTLSGIFLFAAWEWGGLCGLKHGWQRTGYVFLIEIFIGASIYFKALWLINVSVFVWCFTVIYLVYLIRRPAGFLYKGLKSRHCALIGILVLPACWQALYLLYLISPTPYQLLTLFLVVWIADTAAYMTGSRFGKHKLAPFISPAKTIEGTLGAFVAVILLAIIVAIFYGNISQFAWRLAGVFFITTIAAITGDLFESLLKRRQDVKDSGHLLPGHGGILDRIDSLIAAAPVFVLNLKLWGIL